MGCGQFVKKLADDQRRSEHDYNAHIICSVKPAAVAIPGIVAGKAGAGDTGQENDTSISQPGGRYGPIRYTPVRLPVERIEECGRIGEIEGFERLRHVGEADRQAPNGEAPDSEDSQIPGQKAQIGEQSFPAGEWAAKNNIKEGKPHEQCSYDSASCQGNSPMGRQGGEDVQKGLQRHIHGEKTGQRLPGWNGEAG